MAKGGKTGAKAGDTSNSMSSSQKQNGVKSAAAAASPTANGQTGGGGGGGAKKSASKSQSSGKGSSSGSSAASTPLSTLETVVAGLLVVSAMAAVLGAAQLAWTGRLRVLQPRDGKATLDSLSTFAGKLEFTAKYWILGLLWLYFHIHAVMFARMTSKATNPLSGHEDRVQGAKFVFANSIEQFLLLVVSQTAVLPYLSPVQVMHMVPLFNALFLVGRVLFWIGYPKRRSFGFVAGMLPSSLCILYAAYQFATTHVDRANPDSLFKLAL